MNNIFRVYQATVRDLDDLVHIFDQYRMFYNQESNLLGAKEFLFSKFEHQESIVFLVRENSSDRLIGFVQLYPTFSSISMKRSWILNDLYVIEEFRSQGLAKRLLNEAKEFAIKTKAKGIELSTALDNARAQRLYEALGYKRDEEYYHYYLSL